MSDPKPADVTAGDTVAEGLAAHYRVSLSCIGGRGWGYRCTCGEDIRLQPAMSIDGTPPEVEALHRAHVAAALAPTVTAMVTAGQAEALEVAAVRVEGRRREVYAEIEEGRGKWNARKYAGGLTEALAIIRGGA